MRNKSRKLFLFTTLLFTCATVFAQNNLPVFDANAPAVDYANPKRYIINDIKVEGIKYFDPRTAAATSGIVKGDTIYVPGDYLSSAIRRLWSQQHFSDVQIFAEPDGDLLNLTIFLQERPRVRNWDFEGIRKSEKKALTDKLKLRRGSELSDYRIKTANETIIAFFREKGYLNVEVKPTFVSDTATNNAVSVIFRVTKNPRVKVGSIVFEGNESFSDRRLRKTFKKTHQKSINFLKSSKFKEKEYEADKENLVDFYNSKGHRNATIITDTIWDINNKRIGIAVTVEEGNKYYFRNISWMGNSIYQTDYLKNMLGIESGDIYDKQTMHKRLGIGREANPEEVSISNLYQNEGYLFSRVEPIETIVGEDSIDVDIKILEGKQASINDVSFSGNMRINDEVIRRELYIRPGELYNQSLVMETYRLLTQMGHFFPENIQPNINPISNDKVNISFALEEQASDQFEISGGWGAGMFVGSVGVRLNNLSMKNFFKKGAWRPYPSGQSQSLGIRAQTNGSYYKALSLNFTEPWLGGKKPNTLSVSAFYSVETDAYYAWQKGTRHFRTIGASIGIGRRLSWPDRNFTLYNEIGYQAYDLKDWTGFIVSNGKSNIITFKTIFSRNSIDSPIFSRTGSEFSLSLALTPPYSLFQKNIDYKDPELPDNVRYKWIEYHKWMLKAQWFYPLTTNRNLVLMARLDMGYLGSYNKNKPSPFEGFDVGGDGMSGYSIYGVDMIRMRGYGEGELTPYSYTNDYARAYNKYTIELRYPVMLKPNSMIYVLAFAEGGNGFENWKKFNPFTIKRSVGAGVRIYLPYIGMLGLDFGYGFDNPVGSSTRGGGKIHFMIGQEF